MQAGWGAHSSHSSLLPRTSLLSRAGFSPLSLPCPLQPLLAGVQGGWHSAGAPLAHPGFHTLYLPLGRKGAAERAVGLRVGCGEGLRSRAEEGSLLRAGGSRPVPAPPARSTVPRRQLGACEQPVLPPCSKQELPLAVPQPRRSLCGAPGGPSPAPGTAAWLSYLLPPPPPQQPTGAARMPNPSTTSIPLLSLRRLGPRHGTAPPASATVSPNPGSELSCLFRLFGFSLAHKSPDPGSLSANQTESRGLPR